LSTWYYKRLFYGSDSVERDVGKVREAIARALQIDPDLAYAHLRLGISHEAIDWDWKAAQMEYERAQVLDPNSAEVKIALAGLARTFGRLDEAISVYRKVLSQDPLDTYTLWNLAWALYLADRMEEAV